MPVNINSSPDNEVYQREQYRKGGFGKWYWDYRDKQIISFIKNADFLKMARILTFKFKEAFYDFGHSALIV